MTEIQTQAASRLTRWANVGERGAAVAFVGREAEIDLAIDQLATWRPGTSPGRTVVAQGAPGAGKTALLHEIGQRLARRLPQANAVYRATPWGRPSVGNVLLALAQKMLGASEDASRITTETITSNGAKADALAHDGRPQSSAPPTLACWDDLETLFGHQAKQAKPTLLLVDEIQRIGDDDETADLLFHLHDQTTFPVVLVCGGLSTAAARLREVGISRLADGNVLRIDALAPEQAEQCLERSLGMMADDVGISGHADHWARQLAPATRGWPQHVTCHIRAAAGALRDSGRLAFDVDNLDDARRRAEADMRRYYEQRLETSRTDAAVVFAVQAAATRRETYAEDAADLVDTVAATLSGQRRSGHASRFPDGMGCVQQMLHAGVIAYAGSTTTSPLSVPIPSMAAHIASLLSAEQRVDILRTLGIH